MISISYLIYFKYISRNKNEKSQRKKKKKNPFIYNQFKPNGS